MNLTSQRRKELYEQRKQIGQCHLCSMAAVPGKAMCVSCQKIRNEYARKQRRTIGRFYCAKIYARQKQKDWSLTKSEYYAKIKQPCTYCGLKNDVEAGIGLDRIDNGIGYHSNNVNSCCTDCNYVRGNRFSVEEMKSIGSAIRQVKENRDTRHFESL